jgi:hypothetical protein
MAKRTFDKNFDDEEYVRQIRYFLKHRKKCGKLSFSACNHCIFEKHEDCSPVARRKFLTEISKLLSPEELLNLF